MTNKPSSYISPNAVVKNTKYEFFTSISKNVFCRYKILFVANVYNKTGCLVIAKAYMKCA